jgi:hypothetical protein
MRFGPRFRLIATGTLFLGCVPLAGQWMSGWESIGTVPGAGSIAAVSWGSGRFDLFARGSNNEVLHKFFGGAWGPGSMTAAWEFIGTVPGNGPITTVSWGSGRFDLFARGSNNGVLHKFFGGAWGPGSMTAAWESIGTVAGASPITAVSWGSGRFDLFAWDSNTEVLHKYFEGGWGPSSMTALWEALGTVTGGGPVTAVSWGSGRLDLFARASNNEVLHKYFARPATPTWRVLICSTGENVINGVDVTAKNKQEAESAVQVRQVLAFTRRLYPDAHVCQAGAQPR